mmetsp:Transcript_9576/g.21014  ORF Transcript_9576/g.21014 Transcript_9576/m.21014 type:complete len:89 (-) Transcript_9576:24-290(-)
MAALSSAEGCCGGTAADPIATSEVGAATGAGDADSAVCHGVSGAGEAVTLAATSAAASGDPSIGDDEVAFNSPDAGATCGAMTASNQA